MYAVLNITHKQSVVSKYQNLLPIAVRNQTSGIYSPNIFTERVTIFR